MKIELVCFVVTKNVLFLFSTLVGVDIRELTLKRRTPVTTAERWTQRSEQGVLHTSILVRHAGTAEEAIGARDDSLIRLKDQQFEPGICQNGFYWNADDLLNIQHF
jgi:hypothetical protein